MNTENWVKWMMEGRLMLPKDYAETVAISLERDALDHLKRTIRDTAEEVIIRALEREREEVIAIVESEFGSDLAKDVIAAIRKRNK